MEELTEKQVIPIIVLHVYSTAVGNKSNIFFIVTYIDLKHIGLDAQIWN